jgi:hypothetical protein
VDKGGHVTGHSNEEALFSGGEQTAVFAHVVGHLISPVR